MKTSPSTLHQPILSAFPTDQYEVVVTRTSWSSKTITVSAKDVDEAKEFALKKAANMVFSEDDADYDVEFVGLAGE